MTQFAEGFAFESIDARPSIVLELTFGDEAGLAQHAQVSAHRRARHGERVRQLACPLGAPTQELDHAAPRGIGQGAQGAVEVIGRGQWNSECVA